MRSSTARRLLSTQQQQAGGEQLKHKLAQCTSSAQVAQLAAEYDWNSGFSPSTGNQHNLFTALKLLNKLDTGSGGSGTTTTIERLLANAERESLSPSQLTQVYASLARPTPKYWLKQVLDNLRVLSGSELALVANSLSSSAAAAPSSTAAAAAAPAPTPTLRHRPSSKHRTTTLEHENEEDKEIDSAAASSSQETALVLKRIVHEVCQRPLTVGTTTTTNTTDGISLDDFVSVLTQCRKLDFPSPALCDKIADELVLLADAPTDGSTSSNSSLKPLRATHVVQLVDCLAAWDYTQDRELVDCLCEELAVRRVNLDDFSNQDFQSIMDGLLSLGHGGQGDTAVEELGARFSSEMEARVTKAFFRKWNKLVYAVLGTGCVAIVAPVLLAAAGV